MLAPDGGSRVSRLKYYCAGTAQPPQR